MTDMTKLLIARPSASCQQFFRSLIRLDWLTQRTAFWLIISQIAIWLLVTVIVIAVSGPTSYLGVPSDELEKCFNAERNALHASTVFELASSLISVAEIFALWRWSDILNVCFLCFVTLRVCFLEFTERERVCVCVCIVHIS